MPGELRTGDYLAAVLSEVAEHGPGRVAAIQNPAAERGNGGTGAALDG